MRGGRREGWREETGRGERGKRQSTNNTIGEEIGKKLGCG